jgi:hypothetical protein
MIYKKIVTLILLFNSIKMEFAVPYSGHILYHKNGRTGSVSNAKKDTVTFKILPTHIHIQAFNQSL